MRFLFEKPLTILPKYVRIGEQNRGYFAYGGIHQRCISVTEGYFAYGEYTGTLPESASYSRFGVVCEADSTSKARRATSHFAP